MTSSDRKKCPSRKQKRQLNANDSCSDDDSDLDLSKELLPISGYVYDSEQLVQHMFRSISAKKLKAMMPDILKV